MRTYLFDRARQILLNDWVVKRAVTNNNIYFEVRNEKGKIHNVTIGYDMKTVNGKNNDWILSYACDCEYMSISGIKNKQMCSHIFACIGFLIGIRRKETPE